MHGSRGGTGGPEPPENYKNIGLLSNTGLDLLKITKISSLAAFNVWPSSARHLNDVSMVGR